jgi:hypothetical protein
MYIWMLMLETVEMWNPSIMTVEGTDMDPMAKMEMDMNMHMTQTVMMLEMNTSMNHTNMNTCWIVKSEMRATNSNCVSSMSMLMIVVVMDPTMKVLETMEMRNPSMVPVPTTATTCVCKM